jgi:hypothetical protein
MANVNHVRIGKDACRAMREDVWSVRLGGTCILLRANRLNAGYARSMMDILICVRSATMRNLRLYVLLVRYPTITR